MEVGKLAKWHVKEGDTVRSGDVIAEIETDKATMEVEAVDEGRIGKLLGGRRHRACAGEPANRLCFSPTTTSAAPSRRGTALLLRTTALSTLHGKRLTLRSGASAPVSKGEVLGYRA